MKEYKNFGEFVREKRMGNHLTMRAFCSEIGISVPFLVDVENDRRNPFDIEKLNCMVDVLNLSSEEKDQMFDLAGKKRNAVAPDLPDYIKGREYVGVALRKARDLGASEEDWMRFVEDLKKRKG